MPYKNLEAKQQWEREHREQRNARRRKGGLCAGMEPIAPTLAPNLRLQRGAASSLKTASNQELEVGYVVALLLLFLVGVGLVMYFARAGRATDTPSDPIPAREPKAVSKIVRIGACGLVVGLIAFAALAGLYGGEGGGAYDPGQ
jgi:hypothetical protein